MSQILAIALNTFKEAVRNRILYLILFFAIIMMAFSGILSQLSIADQTKVVKDLGFASINLFGVAISVFIGVSLVYNELERKTIYTIVSKPIHRWQFLLGKFFGLLMTVYVNVLIMTLFFLFILHYNAGIEAGDHGLIQIILRSAGKAVITLFDWNAYPATRNVMPVIAATVMELAIVTSFAILFSSFSTPFLSMIFTVLTFIAGRLNEDIILFAENIAQRVAKSGGDLPLIYYLAVGAAHITPNLGVFHRTVVQALYENQVTIWWESVVYALAYPIGILFLAMLVFNRRNFK
ncbi:ABC transporter permease [Candidatus Sumerlaeota bacterium]|nr:ABC transporter permease [Candidatus Sumerlaeota bacterium]MBI3735373.1 ABC transporter permease [Candidatus Sumerlaeota bacterium]